MNTVLIHDLNVKIHKSILYSECIHVALWKHTMTERSGNYQCFHKEHELRDDSGWNRDSKMKSCTQQSYFDYNMWHMVIAVVRPRFWCHWWHLYFVFLTMFRSLKRFLHLSVVFGDIIVMTYTQIFKPCCRQVLFKNMVRKSSSEKYNFYLNYL